MSNDAKVTSNCVYRRTFRVSHDLPEENKVAFFDESKSELVVVNALGGAIWHLLDGSTSVADICALLVSEVEGAPSACDVEQQVCDYLASLLSRRAIELVSTGS